MTPPQSLRSRLTLIILTPLLIVSLVVGFWRYLRLIGESYGGGPVGIETLSAALSESRDALEEVIEPYLLQQGLIQRTPRGRMLAQAAWRHLGLQAPRSPGAQGALFDIDDD